MKLLSEQCYEDSEIECDRLNERFVGLRRIVERVVEGWRALTPEEARRWLALCREQEIDEIRDAERRHAALDAVSMKRHHVIGEREVAKLGREDDAQQFEHRRVVDVRRRAEQERDRAERLHKGSLMLGRQHTKHAGLVQRKLEHQAVVVERLAEAHAIQRVVERHIATRLDEAWHAVRRRSVDRLTHTTHFDLLADRMLPERADVCALLVLRSSVSRTSQHRH